MGYHFFKKCICTSLLVAFSTPAFAQSHQNSSRIYSKNVKVLPAEKSIGIVSYKQILPIFRAFNKKRNYFKPEQFDYFIENFHYPNRGRFNIRQKPPPAHIILHWTANKHVTNPLVTLSAFLRSVRRGRVREREDRYKNVSNYYLTGTLSNSQGQSKAYMVKMTRNNLRGKGDIPRVTAYPTKDNWDDNKYDGRGAIGVEIDGPNFRSIYNNPHQKRILIKWMALILSQRGQYGKFRQLKQSRYWSHFKRVYAFLKKNLMAMDVDPAGRIAYEFRTMENVLKQINGLPADLYPEIKKMFSFISGHGVVGQEYNKRMIKAGRRKDARYHKIDFTEPHVFVMGMDLLRANLPMGDGGYDLFTMELLRQEQEQSLRKPAPLAFGSPGHLLVGAEPLSKLSFSAENLKTRMLLLD